MHTVKVLYKSVTNSTIVHLYFLLTTVGFLNAVIKF